MRLNAAPVTGALPVKVPAPMLVNVHVNILLLPSDTPPKSKDGLQAERAGPDSTIPLPLRETLIKPPLLARFTSPPKGPALAGSNFTVISWFAPTVRLKGGPATILKGRKVVAVPERRLPGVPVFVTWKVRFLPSPTFTSLKSKEAGITDKIGVVAPGPAPEMAMPRGETIPGMSGLTLEGQK
jgi:hypothetical protein